MKQQHKLDINDLKILLGICERALICTVEIFIEKKVNINGDERIFITAPEKLEKPMMITAMLPYTGDEYERCLKNGTKLYEEYIAKDQSGRESDMVHPVVETFKRISDVVID